MDKEICIKNPHWKDSLNKIGIKNVCDNCVDKKICKKQNGKRMVV